MHIALFGATGRVGGAIAREALSRGHTVTAIARDPAKLQMKHANLTVRTGDVTSADSVAANVNGHDALAVAIGGRREGNHDVVPTAAKAVLEGLPRAGVKRLVWVGGGGTLEVATGIPLLETPTFPNTAKEPRAQWEAFEVFRLSETPVEWSFFAPPPGMEQGPKTGTFRTSAEKLLRDTDGKSRISFEDYAVAFVNELERAEHTRQRWTAAY